MERKRMSGERRGSVSREKGEGECAVERNDHYKFVIQQICNKNYGSKNVHVIRTLNPAAAVDTTGELPPPIDLGLVEGVVLGESSLPAASCCIDSTPRDVPATEEIRWPVDSTGFQST